MSVDPQGIDHCVLGGRGTDESGHRSADWDDASCGQEQPAKRFRQARVLESDGSCLVVRAADVWRKR